MAIAQRVVKIIIHAPWTPLREVTPLVTFNALIQSSQLVPITMDAAHPAVTPSPITTVSPSAETRSWRWENSAMEIVPQAARTKMCALSIVYLVLQAPVMRNA